MVVRWSAQHHDTHSGTGMEFSGTIITWTETYCYTHWCRDQCLVWYTRFPYQRQWFIFDLGYSGMSCRRTTSVYIDSFSSNIIRWSHCRSCYIIFFSAVIFGKALGLTYPEDLFDAHFFRENPAPFYKFARRVSYRFFAVVLLLLWWRTGTFIPLIPTFDLHHTNPSVARWPNWTKTLYSCIFHLERPMM